MLVFKANRVEEVMKTVEGDPALESLRIFSKI
jgi:hypothetical protein